MAIKKNCRLCKKEFEIVQMSLTPLSVCPSCREKTVKFNIQCIVQGWIDACPEVKMEVKIRKRNLKSGIKHYFHIKGDISYTGKSENIYADPHFFAYKVLLSLIKKSFNKANITSGGFGSRKFNIVVAEY